VSQKSHPFEPNHQGTLEMLKKAAQAQRDRSAEGALPTGSPVGPSKPPMKPPTPGGPQAVDWSTIDPQELTLNGLEKLFASVQKGDAAAQAAFVNFLEVGGSAVWRQAGDLAGLAETALLTTLYSGSPTLSLSGRRKFQELRAELTSEDDTPLKKLAIERVVHTSMFVFVVDAFVAMQGLDGLLSARLAQAQHLAERRLNLALKSLKTAEEISRAAVAGRPSHADSKARETETALQTACG
jgi:hypothetical protein